MFNYRGWFVSPSTSARGQLFINSVTLYVYDAANVMNDDNYATVLQSFVSTSSLQVVQINTKKVFGLNHLVLAKKWGISPKKALNITCHTTQHGVHTVLHPCISPCQGSVGQMIVSYSTGDYYTLCTGIHYLPLQCLGEAIGVHKYLPLILAGHTHS